MGCNSTTSANTNKELPIYKLIILGLDKSGKTTILNQISMQGFVPTSPTLGVNTISLTYNNSIKLIVFDVSGNARSLWDMYFQSIDSIIFVIDSTDHQRFEIAKTQLHRVDSTMSNEQTFILIFINKIDLITPGDQDIYHYLQKLEIGKLRNDVIVEKCSGLTGDGIRQGFGKLLRVSAKQIQRQNSKQQESK